MPLIAALHRQFDPFAVLHPRSSKGSSEENESQDEKLPEKSLAMEGPQVNDVGKEEEDESSSNEAISQSKSGSHLTDSSIEKKKDIFINFEVLRANHHKAAQALWIILLMLATAYFGVMIFYRVGENHSVRIVRSQHLIKLQTATAVVLFSLLCPMLGWFARQLWATRMCDWSRRQRYLVTIAFVQICFQAINLVFWLIPNAYILANQCDFIAPIVNASVYIRWTCWNTVFALQLIHGRNCWPKTRIAGKDEDASPDLDNPKLKAEGRRDPMVLDADWRTAHWPVIVAWCLAEATILYLPASGGPEWVTGNIPPGPIYCTLTELPGNVRPNKYPRTTFKWDALKTIWGGWLVAYLCFSAGYSRTASARLRGHAYSEYKFANLLMLWQRRLSIWVEALGIADSASTMLSGGGLVTFVQEWTGQGTLQILTTATTALSAFYFLPMEPTTEEHYYQVWLQKFAWTQPGIAKQRRAMLKHSPGMEARLRTMPLFCMETALKLLLWSDVVYECVVEPDGPLGPQKQQNGGMPEAQPESQPLSEGTAEAAREGQESSDSEDEEDPKLTSIKVVEALSGKEALDLAMRMFDMTHVKVIHSTVTDTKAVLAWGDTGMVLAFRGTQSMVDACIDLKAWTVAHPPRRGLICLGTRPLVHKGFLMAWSEVADRVGEAVREVLDGLTEGQREAFQVFVTGHSLGGALAVLAAFQIQEQHRLPRICCYTYGAPRTGNAAFANEYERLVPDTFHVINDRDAVPKTGKLMGMYKRPGDRVLINALGDIRVRPSIFEVNLHSSGYSVKQHYLVSYLEALGSILLAQLFKYRAVEGGLKGVTQLSKCPNICRLLASVGVDLPDLVAKPPRSMKHTVSQKKGLKKLQTNLVALIRDLQSTPFALQAD